MSDEEIWKRGVDLSYVIDAYKNLNIGDHFFRPFFRTAGRNRLCPQDDNRRKERRRNQKTAGKAMWKSSRNSVSPICFIKNDYSYKPEPINQ